MINKEELETLIAEGYSQTELAETFNVSRTTMRRRLDQFGIKTTNRRKNQPPSCTCGETNPEKFLIGRPSQCRICHTAKNIQKGKATKQFGIDLLGGSCKHCGYKKSQRALQFHHTTPKAKDKNFSGLRGWNRERLAKELENCILLCANCHAEEHEYLDTQKSITARDSDNMSS